MRIVVCLLVPLIPIATLAYGADMPLSFMVEHIDFFQWIFAGSLLGLGFFMNRSLRSFDKHVDLQRVNNEQQWKAITALATRLSLLEGQHNAIHSGMGPMPGGRRAYDPEERLSSGE